MKIAWLTDIHLNFLDSEARKHFYERIKLANIDIIVITGDIGEADDFIKYIDEMKKYTDREVYFVLGNHDYYGGSIGRIREMLANTRAKTYLADAMIIMGNTFLIGQDGFADGRAGNYAESRVVLNDHLHIGEFALAHYRNRPDILRVMQKWADQDAKDMGEKIIDAIEDGAKRIIIATHVPPWPLVSTYRGEPSDDDHMPFYCSVVMGEVIEQFAEQHPDVSFLVLCGHTHGKQYYKVLRNLECYCGDAEYRYPKVNGIIDTETLDVEWL